MSVSRGREEYLSLHYDGTRPVRTVTKVLFADRRRLLLAIAAFAAKHSPTWLLPVFTANIVDVVVARRPLSQLWLNAALLALVLVQNIPMNQIFVRQLSRVVRELGTGVRSALCGRLPELSIGYHAKSSPAVLQAKVVRDVDNVVQMLQQAFNSGLAAITTLIGALALTAVRVPMFVGVFVLPITRAHGLEKAALRRVQAPVRQVGDTGFALDLVNGRFGALSWTVYNLLGGACLVFSALCAYTKLLPVTAGDVVLLSSYFAVLTTSVIMLMGLAPVFTQGLESVRSIGEVLTAPDREYNDGKHSVSAVTGDIEFDEVTFQYEPGGPAVLDQFDLRVAAGETVAVVGPSGAGKSTLLNLAIGFLRPTAGSGLMDGLDMNSLDLRTYRRFVSVVPQESVLFDGSVRENVTYGMPGVGDDMLRNALTDANALEFVERLDAGWDTIVGERGARLSGGQRQRLAIARALIRDPKVLVLDEATSALDTESEALVQAALVRLMRERTAFVVAHRLSTVRSADRIVVLEGGHVVEAGSHDELVALNGRYKQLYARQSA